MKYVEAGRASDYKSNNEFRILIRFFHSSKPLDYYENVHTFEINNIPKGGRRDFTTDSVANTYSITIPNFVKLAERRVAVEDWKKSYFMLYFYESDPVYADDFGTHKIKTRVLGELYAANKQLKDEYEFHHGTYDAKAKIIFDVYNPTKINR